MNEDSICNSVISVPFVANGFWLRLRRAVFSVVKGIAHAKAPRAPREKE